MLQLKLRPEIPVPMAPKRAYLQVALRGIFRADKLAWGLWSLRAGACLEAGAAGSSLRWIPLPFPNAREAGRSQAMAGRPLAGPGARLLW